MAAVSSRGRVEKRSELLEDYENGAVDANMFNRPYSVHRLLNIDKYTPYGYVLASKKLKKLDEDLLRKGERPEAYLDLPIGVENYEIIDLFNWKNEAKTMKSQLEFIGMVDVQALGWE